MFDNHKLQVRQSFGLFDPELRSKLRQALSRDGPEVLSLKAKHGKTSQYWSKGKKNGARWCVYFLLDT